ncbi:putative cytochrome P450 [Macrophomina phaseolina]|uniref:Cytochrome P450 n=1 Tax=Macrophomina phaseolina TaxID=35725 RepID=A0ABQ8GAP0_9PEZI|nr:putative cytochrome P450 [Macrophomina phaseolina]
MHPLRATTVALVAYWAVLAIYRLRFHPLAKFPGPKIASLTYLFEAYHDVLRPGQYTAVIIKLHKRYGPIIRINPDELHVSDPNFVDALYPSTGKKREISPWFFKPMGIAETHFGTADHDLHRMRRAPLSRFFSKAMVARLEPSLKQHATKFCRNLETWSGTANALDLVTSISCFSADIITEYLFGRCYNFLDDPKMKVSLYQPIHVGAEATIAFKHFPPYMKLFLSIPTFVMKRLSPDSEMWRQFRLDSRTRVREVKEDIRRNVPKSRTTVFHDLLASNLPESEKSTERLGMEAQALVGAGIETTAWSLSVDMFHLLSLPDTMAKLRAELEAAIPSSVPSKMPPWTTLEKLPYLTACIHEGLRLSYGVPSRLARISPDEPMIYRGPDKTWAIPPGYAVGMSAFDIHHKESIFPESRKYIPERWLDDNGMMSKRLDPYFLSFSKGSRNCLGMNLAYAELYTLLATVVRCFGDRLELFETTAEDVAFHHDAFIPAVKPGSKGVRVLVK